MVGVVEEVAQLIPADSDGLVDEVWAA